MKSIQVSKKLNRPIQIIYKIKSLSNFNPISIFPPYKMFKNVLVNITFV